MADDSIEGIYDTLKQCALISKNAGGIGLNIHCIRALGTYIAGVSQSRNSNKDERQRGLHAPVGVRNNDNNNY